MESVAIYCRLSKDERCVSKKDGVVYIGPRPGTLTNDMVNIIREILG